MSLEEIPDLTKLFHQLALTNPDKEEKYALAILDLNGLKEFKDPVALAFALKVSFKKMVREIEDVLDRLTIESKDGLLFLEEEEDSEEETIMCHTFTGCVEKISRDIGEIRMIIHGFKNIHKDTPLHTVSNILEKEIYEPLDSIISSVYRKLYINKGDYYDDTEEYAESIDAIRVFSQRSKTTLTKIEKELFSKLHIKGGKKVLLKK